MSLPPAIANHHMILVALILLGRRAAEHLGVALDSSVTELARRVERNRTYIYEVTARVIAAIAPAAASTPGRPRLDSSGESGEDLAFLRLRNEVLQHRLEHPGACVARDSGRTRYSSGFRRFILERLDTWLGDRTLEEFAGAADVPLDTLRDWIRKDREAQAAQRHDSPDGVEPGDRDEVMRVAPVPRDAAAIVHDIARDFACWEGDTRDFVNWAKERMDLLPGQIWRVLRILGLIRRYRRSNDRHRYRESTTRLTPGSLLTTDGKTIDFLIIDRGDDEQDDDELELVKVNWQGTVDHATGCHTAVVVTDSESVNSAGIAYAESVEFLGGVPPLGVLLDNRPCYDSPLLEVYMAPSEVIHTTEGRPEDNAVIEGTFGRYEQQVGSFVIDATTPECLRETIAEAVIRAWAAGVDHAPRPELGGRSRAAALRESRPSPEQIERDRQFLRRLTARRSNRCRSRSDNPQLRQLLDEEFARWGIDIHDPRGSLRRYLSGFSSSAVRRGLAIFAAKMAEGDLEIDSAHRYLAKVIQNCQDEVNLEIVAEELLDLARRQGQNWTASEQADLAAMEQSAPSTLHLLRDIAERAALGFIPVETAFWTETLLERMREHHSLIDDVRVHLIRFFEAPFERRVALLDQLAALKEGIL